MSSKSRTLQKCTSADGGEASPADDRQSKANKHALNLSVLQSILMTSPHPFSDHFENATYKRDLTGDFIHDKHKCNLCINVMCNLRTNGPLRLSVQGVDICQRNHINEHPQPHIL